MTTRVVNGATVRAIRMAIGIRSGDFATRCGFSPSFLSHLESGGRQPSAATARRIADELAVPLDAITFPRVAQDRAAGDAA